VGYAQCGAKLLGLAMWSKAPWVGYVEQSSLPWALWGALLLGGFWKIEGPFWAFWLWAPPSSSHLRARRFAPAPTSLRSLFILLRCAAQLSLRSSIAPHVRCAHYSYYSVLASLILRIATLFARSLRSLFAPLASSLSINVAREQALWAPPNERSDVKRCIARS
jgi:hypothetical protein